MPNEQPPGESKRHVTSDEAPAGRGPFPQAVRVGPLVFVSGQGPLSPQTNQLIEGDFAAQTRQVFANVGHILQAAGLAGLIASSLNVPLAAAIIVSEVFGSHLGFPAAIAAILGFQANRHHTVYDVTLGEE